MALSINNALDITHGTLQHIQQKKPAYTFLYENYTFLNTFWKNRVKVQGGDNVEGHIILGDEGNAKHSGLWDEDTHNIVNISKKYTMDWVHATTNASWNLIEVDINRGPERVYNVVEMKYDNMCREMSDKILEAVFKTPSSSSDALLPHGVSSWLTMGTNNSTGGWTGYSGHYNDGSTPGTTYNRGGIASSASSNARWASYYADHNGNLDDSLFTLLDRACRKLNFKGPNVPKALDQNTDGYSPTFSLYSNDTVIGTINQIYAKSDEQFGIRPSQHYGYAPVFKGMPFEYVDLLNTANVSLFGTDPIFGINHNLIYPVVLSGWDFNIMPPEKRTGANQHLVVTTYCDLQYAIFCENPRIAGFQISQQ
jgi:hypothetical protein